MPAESQRAPTSGFTGLADVALAPPLSLTKRERDEPGTSANKAPTRTTPPKKTPPRTPPQVPPQADAAAAEARRVANDLHGAKARRMELGELRVEVPAEDVVLPSPRAVVATGVTRAALRSNSALEEPREVEPNLSRVGKQTI